MLRNICSNVLEFCQSITDNVTIKSRFMLHKIKIIDYTYLITRQVSFKTINNVRVVFMSSWRRDYYSFRKSNFVLALLFLHVSNFDIWLESGLLLLRSLLLLLLLVLVLLLLWRCIWQGPWSCWSFRPNSICMWKGI